MSMTRVLEAERSLAPRGPPLHEAVRCGRYPNDPDWKSASKIGSNMSLERTLRHPVADRRNRKDADLAAILRDFLPPGRQRRIGSGPDQFVRDLLEESLYALRFDSLLKVTPSLPGAPSFLLASAYASRSVSSLQTWTYNPQNFQDVSAFALTYILRLRSCKSMDAFVISSLPSL